MIPLLPKWHLQPNRPSFYDTDSATLLELASTLHETMNSLIKDYNNFVDSVNNKITEFTEQTTENQEEFAVALRQEFQDFINIVDMKITGMNNAFTEFTSQVNTSISNQDNKINGMVTNQVPVTQSIINEAIKAGDLTIIETYNEETESLEMTLTGGV